MAEMFSLVNAVTDTRSAIVMTETYAEIANVELLGAELGDYEYCMSVVSSFDTITKSKFFRFSVDGGINWEEGRMEPKDNTDRVFDTYAFVRKQVSGTLSIIIQGRKEDALGIMTVHTSNAWIKRIG